jgi:hypothetical protein
VIVDVDTWTQRQVRTPPDTTQDEPSHTVTDSRRTNIVVMTPIDVHASTRPHPPGRTLPLRSRHGNIAHRIVEHLDRIANRTTRTNQRPRRPRPARRTTRTDTRRSNVAPSTTGDRPVARRDSRRTSGRTIHVRRLTSFRPSSSPRPQPEPRHKRMTTHDSS